MVVESVIRHWVTLVAWEGEGPDGFGRYIQWLEALFQSNDILLALPRPDLIQAALDVLTGLFVRVILQTNVKKVGVACHPCYIFGGHLEAAYTRHMTGVGSSSQ